MLFVVGVDTEEDVLAIRADVLKTLKAGGSVITSWSSEGTSVQKSQGVSLKELLNETALFLQLLNGTGIKRLRPTYI